MTLLFRIKIYTKEAVQPAFPQFFYQGGRIWIGFKLASNVPIAGEALWTKTKL